MLNISTEIRVGKDKFRVVATPDGVCPCTTCQIPNCFTNQAWKEYKQMVGIDQCEKLIGMHKHFEKVEDTPQVVSK